MHTFTLKAPEGVSHSRILGSDYVPDAEGNVTTTNAEHQAEMQRHGYTLIKVEDLIPGAKSPVVPQVQILNVVEPEGQIEIDDLSRPELYNALRARGLDLPKEMPSRAVLAQLAAEWNEQDRVNRNASEIRGGGFTGEETWEEVQNMTFPRLKSFVHSRGITINGHPNKEALLQLAATIFEQA